MAKMGGLHDSCKPFSYCVQLISKFLRLLFQTVWNVAAIVQNEVTPFSKVYQPTENHMAISGSFVEVSIENENKYPGKTESFFAMNTFIYLKTQKHVSKECVVRGKHSDHYHYVSL